MTSTENPITESGHRRSMSGLSPFCWSSRFQSHHLVTIIVYLTTIFLQWQYSMLEFNLRRDVWWAMTHRYFFQWSTMWGRFRLTPT